MNSFLFAAVVRRRPPGWLVPGLTCLLSITSTGVGLARAQAPAPALISPADPRLIARTGNAESLGGAFGGEGRYVVFVSRASNLAPNDTNGRTDVFVRDRVDGSIRLISVNATGTAAAAGESVAPVITPDGRWVAFESTAGDLVSGDTNLQSAVFLRDLTAGTTRLVSVATNGLPRANGGSFAPAVSPDGRYVAFESVATNLVSGILDTNLTTDIFLRDLTEGRTVLVSKHATTNRTGSAASSGPAFSADGARLLFLSNATNLIAGVTNTSGDVYVRDLPNNVNIWVSRNAAALRSALTNSFPANARYRCYNPVISANGRYVAFKMALDATYPAAGIFRHDLLTGGTDVLATNLVASLTGGNDLTGPVMSADGRFIAYEGRTDRTAFPAGLPLIGLWDGDTGQSELISANFQGSAAALGPALGSVVPGSESPVLSPDGRYVAFLSYATNLVAGLLNPTCQVYVRDRQAKVTRAVSLRPDGTAAGDAAVACPVFSPAGDRLLFQSQADDLVPGDFNAAADVFAYDLATGQTELISQALPSATAAGASGAGVAGLSGDGHWLAFTSFAPNLTTDDTNGLSDVFLRDLQLGTNLLVSVAAGGSGSGNGLSRQPQISADGQVVVFTSFASNLVAGFVDANGAEDVYFRRLGGPTTCVVPAGEAATLGTGAPSLSRNGEYVAYQSRAALPATNGVDGNAWSDVYLRSTSSDTNLLISINAGTGAGNAASEVPTLGPDGRWVVFHSRANDLVDPPTAFGGWQIYARDPWNGVTRSLSGPIGEAGPTTNLPPALFSRDGTVALFPWTQARWYRHVFAVNATDAFCTNCAEPSVSADGRWVAFRSGNGTGSPQDVYLCDTQSGTTQLVSVNVDGTGGGNADSTTPLVSGDGRMVVLSSRASNLVPGDTNGWTDVFVRDTVARATMLLSFNPQSGHAANRLSVVSALGDDGRTVILASYASDFVPADGNATRDLFLLRLNAGDLDQDNLPDDWEVAWFGNLGRDGTGDFDGDGASDREEYLAGTNPTNDASVLGVLTLSSVATGETTVLWSAVSGRTYRVQFKDDVDQVAWTELSGDVVATGPQASAVDPAPAPGGRRFYRVLLVR